MKISKLLKPWPQTNTETQRGVQSSTEKYMGKILKTLLKILNATIYDITMQVSAVSVDSKLLNP